MPRAYILMGLPELLVPSLCCKTWQRRSQPGGAPPGLTPASNTQLLAIAGSTQTGSGEKRKENYKQKGLWGILLVTPIILPVFCLSLTEPHKDGWGWGWGWGGCLPLLGVQWSRDGEREKKWGRKGKKNERRGKTKGKVGTSVAPESKQLC